MESVVATWLNCNHWRIVVAGWLAGIDVPSINSSSSNIHPLNWLQAIEQKRRLHGCELKLSEDWAAFELAPALHPSRNLAPSLQAIVRCLEAARKWNPFIIDNTEWSRNKKLHKKGLDKVHRLTHLLGYLASSSFAVSWKRTVLSGAGYVWHIRLALRAIPTRRPSCAQLCWWSMNDRRHNERTHGEMFPCHKSQSYLTMSWSAYMTKVLGEKVESGEVGSLRGSIYCHIVSWHLSGDISISWANMSRSADEGPCALPNLIVISILAKCRRTWLQNEADWNSITSVLIMFSDIPWDVHQKVTLGEVSLFCTKLPAIKNATEL